MHPSKPVTTGVSRFATALAESCVLAALVVTPVYFNPETQRVFEPDKLAWVFILGLGALWAQALANAEMGRAGWRRPSILALGVALVAVVLVASSLPMQAVVPLTSLFGSYYRARGLLAQLAFLVLGFAAAGAMLGNGSRQRFQRALILPVVPVAMYAIFQRLHIDFISWDIYGQGATVRAFGPLGNSLILGAYLMMTLPFLVAGYLQAGEGADGQPNGLRPRNGRRLLYGSLGVLAFVGLLTSQSRGPLMGLMAGLGLMAVLWAALNGRRRLTAALVLGAALGIFTLGAIGRTESSPLGRLGTLLASGSRTAQERRLVWEALERVAENSRPAQRWLGYGPDSLMYVLPPAVSPQLVQLTPEQIFDRAHNNLWEWWVSAGLIGVAAFLMVIVAAITTGYRLLGLIRNRLEMAGLWSAQLAGAVILVAIPVAVGQRELAAVGLPMGLVAGAVLYAAAWGWRRSGAAPATATTGAGDSGRSVKAMVAEPAVEDEDVKLSARGPRWLICALLGAVAAYLVEGTVGIPSAAEDLLFWLCIGALAGLAVAYHRRTNVEPVDDAGAGSGSLSTVSPAVASNEGLAPEASKADHDAEAVLDGLLVSCVLFAPLLHPQAGTTGLSSASALLWLLLPATLAGAWLLRLADRVPVLRAATGRRSRRQQAEVNAPAMPWRRMLMISLGIVVAFRIVYYVLGTFTGGGAITFALVLVGAVVAIATLRSEERPVTAPTEYWRWVPYASLGLLAMLAAWRLGLVPIVADTMLRDGLQAAAATKFDRTRASFDQALALWPYEPLYATFVAGAYRERFLDPNIAKTEQEEAFQRAEAVLLDSLELAPSDQLYQRLGTLYRDRGDKAEDSVGRVQSWQQAQEQYMNALDFAPQRPDTLAELGALFERTGAVSETMQAYEQAFRLNPARRDAAAGLMRVALAQGKVSEAVQWLEALQAQNQANPQLVEDAIKSGEGMPTSGLLARQSQVINLARQGKAAEAKQLLDQIIAENEDAPANLPLAAWLAREAQGAGKR